MVHPCRTALHDVAQAALLETPLNEDTPAATAEYDDARCPPPLSVLRQGASVGQCIRLCCSPSCPRAALRPPADDFRLKCFSAVAPHQHHAFVAVDSGTTHERSPEPASHAMTDRHCSRPTARPRPGAGRVPLAA